MTKRSTFAILAALTLLLAACGGGAPAPTETPVLALASTEAATAAAGGGVPSSGIGLGDAGLCAHPYYPVVVGAVHSYSSTGGVEPFSFTDTITEVREDGFTLSSDFNGLIREQQWLCSPEGLVTLQLTGGAAASIQTSGMNGEFATSNVSGVTLPADVAPGDSWTQSFDISGTMTMSTGDTATSSGNASYVFTAVSIEDVSTSAGVFSALRVEGSGTILLVVTFEGITVPINLESSTVSWYSPEAGWVRLEDTSTIDGASTFSYVVDLESYFIP